MSREFWSSTVDYDVVVVGARCAGAATALLLARSGVSVLVIDRARYGSDTLSTHAFTPPGVLQLGRWGLLDAIRAAGTPQVTSVVQHYDGERIEIPIRPRGLVDGLYAPRRTVLDRILVDAAVEAGAEVRHGIGMREVLAADGRAVGVILDDGRPVRARFVVGADGARSATARCVGAGVYHSSPHSSATVYAYVDGWPGRAYVNHHQPGVVVGVIPTNGEQANVWMSVPMPLLRERRRATATSMYLDTVSRLAGVDRARIRGPFRTFLGQPGFVRACWGPGWALVGDAAHFMDTLSSHGMTDALIGAEILADALISISKGTDETEALRAYADHRQRLIEPMLPAVDHMASFGWDGASLQQAHLALNAAMRAEWDFLMALP